MQYEPYIPTTIGEVLDQLGFMMLASPTFIDPLGMLPDQNIETVFFQLNEGLKAIRGEIGDERYAKLVTLSGHMRTHFEADPEDKTEDSLAGRRLIQEMEAILGVTYPEE